MDAQRKAELERLAGLTHAGAVRAAAAFAQLMDTPVSALRPVICERGAGSFARSERTREDAGTTGVFFEFEGCVDALVGILFPAGASDALVRSIVGIESGELDPAIVESALMEVGNILASHVASGIADALHSRLLPSIPALASEHAEREFAAWVENAAGADAAHLESTLSAPDGNAVGRLVIVPVDGAGQAGNRAAPATEPVC
jgi:chemotaxis protein CheY-P-specific phosphatase CheC